MVTTWGHTFIARKPSNGDASGEVVATVTMSKVPIRPCSQKSDGTRVVVGALGTVEEEPVIAPYARPEKSEAQLREYRGRVLLRLCHRPIGATVARQIPVLKVTRSNRVSVIMGSRGRCRP